jgi:lipopolysaccharide export system protein LptA
MTRHGRAAAVFALAALAAYRASPVAAEVSLPGATSSKAPIEITADDGIEWQQKSQAYVARGHARAAQGDSAVHADVLTAFYAGGQGQPTKITRIDAVGHVRLVSPNGTATGSKAAYDVAKGILVLTGHPVLVTRTDRITARDSLEFWRDRNLVVARGAAHAVREGRRLSADVLTAHLAKGPKGQDQITRIDAFDHVVVSTPSEIVRAARGVYNLQTGIATLTGSVKITRGDNQLNGDRAVVDLNTGKSRLLSAPGEPVRGILVPGEKKNGKASAPPAGSAGARP